MSDTLGNWRSYRLSAPATVLVDQTFTSSCRAAIKQPLTSAALRPVHTPQPTSLPTGARRATSPVKHLSNQRSFSGPTTVPKKWVVIEVTTQTKTPHFYCNIAHAVHSAMVTKFLYFVQAVYLPHVITSSNLTVEIDYLILYILNL